MTSNLLTKYTMAIDGFYQGEAVFSTQPDARITTRLVKSTAISEGTATKEPQYGVAVDVTDDYSGRRAEDQLKIIPVPEEDSSAGELPTSTILVMGDPNLDKAFGQGNEDYKLSTGIREAARMIERVALQILRVLESNPHKGLEAIRMLDFDGPSPERNLISFAEQAATDRGPRLVVDTQELALHPEVLRHIQSIVIENVNACYEEARE